MTKDTLRCFEMIISIVVQKMRYTLLLGYSVFFMFMKTKDADPVRK